MASKDSSAGRTRNLSKVVRIDEAKIGDHVNQVVRSTVEETLNGLLDAEAERLCGAKRYERHPTVWIAQVAVRIRVDRCPSVVAMAWAFGPKDRRAAGRHSLAFRKLSR